MASEGVSNGSTTGSLAMWNGTRDDHDGYIDYTNGSTNLNELRIVKIVPKDIRACGLTLQKDGLQLMRSKTALTTEQLMMGDSPEGRELIDKKYFPEIRDIVATLTGYSSIYPYASRVRTHNTSLEKIRGAHIGSSSLPLAHVDQDFQSAPQRVIDGLGAETADKVMNHKHWAQINVWRPIGCNVQQWPLAFVDHDAIPEWSYDTHTARLFPRNDNTTSRYKLSHYVLLKDDSAYRYRYASQVSPEEVLIFFSFHTDPTKVTPHGAFWDDSTAPDAPSRCSIEVRSWVGWD